MKHLKYKLKNEVGDTRGYKTPKIHKELFKTLSRIRFQNSNAIMYTLSPDTPLMLCLQIFLSTHNLKYILQC